MHTLVTEEDGIYLDCTLGGGGHAQAILEALGPQGLLLGIDVDEDAMQFASEKLRQWGDKVRVRRWNYDAVDGLLRSEGISRLHGALFDLGVSSHQIDTASRGFSYRVSGPLDMRMNQQEEKSAFQVVNQYDEKQLTKVLLQYGEEKLSRRIARTIVAERARGEISNTFQLSTIVSRVVPAKTRVKTLSRVFQGIRMEVNQELPRLQKALESVIPYLAVGGRIVVIAYESLQDRLVKNFFRLEEKKCTCPPDLPQCVCRQSGRLRVITRKAIRPSREEKERNRRGHSARLRVAERTA